jgi:hypothetical protein
MPEADYEAILSIAKSVDSVLEFGPGESTKALIEAGVREIVTVEHNDKWFEVARRTLKAHKNITLLRYHDAPVVEMPEIQGRLFDLAIVDSPPGAGNRSRIVHPGQEGLSRFNTLKFACEHAKIVMLHDADRPDDVASIERLGFAWRLVGQKFALIETGLC